MSIGILFHSSQTGYLLSDACFASSFLQRNAKARREGFVQGEVKKISSNDGDTVISHWHFELLASANGTGDGSQILFSFQLLHIVDTSSMHSHPQGKDS